jgi:Tol biopolymer transport system component
MTSRLACCCIGLFLFVDSMDAQQVVFSRRVYKTRGQSFQQLWIWSPMDGKLEPLTRSARNHERPTCSRDGTQVFFGSDEDRWRLDRNTGIEQRVDDRSAAETVATSDAPSVQVPQCDDGTLSTSPDGLRVACAAHGEEIVIVDLGSLQEIERVAFGQRYSSGERYPPWSLQSTWSPDVRQLLVGTYGGSSTSPALDYFLLDLATERWTRAFTGNDPVWMPDGANIVFTTPRELVPLPGSWKRHVWAEHLAVYNLAADQSTLLTSGVTNNMQPTVCGSLNSR